MGGGGAAGGGSLGGWKPKKESDRGFLGKPNSTKRTHFDGKKGGYDRDTKIGPEGKDIMERHHTDHNTPNKHSDPHANLIEWDLYTGNPITGSPINYPNGVPEFKNCKEAIYMNKNLPTEEYFEANRFKTISDFKWAMKCNSEVEFEWRDKVYYITHPDGVINIHEEGYYLEAKEYETADEALEYIVGNDRLRDVINKVKVWSRTI